MKALRGNRLHIGIFGRRNAGKSSLINALAHQDVAIVSEVAGTTTDPVEKAMELLPIGPVQLIDTAGIDDIGQLGRMRIRRTQQVFDRTELGIVVAEAGRWSETEQQIVDQLLQREAAVIVVFNKIDNLQVDPAHLAALSDRKLQTVCVSALTGQGMGRLRQALIDATPDEYLQPPALCADLVPPGGLVVLVVPIDKEAPKGRLILPQVATIRDLLDNDSMALVVKERELREALDRLSRPPALVVTDSQAFLKVAADTPDAVPMTSFSILFARHKGDLRTFVEGARALDRLGSGDRVLIAESCTHHPIADDIGRVKIPRWVRQYVGADIQFDVHAGHDYPEDLGRYKLVIHCGGCMNNRRELLSRIMRCREQDVAITNYGMAIAYTLGIFDRALQPFGLINDAMR